MSTVYILRASKHTNPEVWLNSDVEFLLTPLLPKNEATKWRMLPWAQQPNASAEKSALFATHNQALARAYCPAASRILDVVTTPEMWSNRKVIDALISKFAKPSLGAEKVDNAGELFDMT